MKQLLRTYALGLLTATAIIGIYYFYFMDNEPNSIEVDMTEAEMVSSLETAGYYIYETDPIISSPVDQEIEDDSAEDEQAEDENNDTDISEENSRSDEANDHNSFILTIEPGMTISQVADYLMIANLIESRSEFTSYLADNDYGTNIQVGQFELNREMSLDEVVDTIANQNN
ncbi:hypothetical protein ACS127_15090 [Amphibacillus sp. Q70]|uniref:hypothetical protein n=1 Tax=Amphibacillus sp. Q70 TaxID=3453416 RepID=UPI003F847A69